MTNGGPFNKLTQKKLMVKKNTKIGGWALWYHKKYWKWWQWKSLNL